MRAHTNRNKNAKKERELLKQGRLSGYPCETKIWFSKKKLCERAIAKQEEKFGVKLYAYKCNFCKNYHMTSQPPRYPR